MDISVLLDELENELSDRKGGIFAKKVDLDKCCKIVAQLKSAFPETLREAQYVMENKQKILENADNVAKNTIREAEERAEHIIDNSEITKRAERESKQIVEMAYMQADSLIDKTKLHLDNMFRDIEQFLLSTLTMIRNNREELKGAMIVKARD